MNRLSKVLISAFILLNFMSMMRIHVPLDHSFFSSIYRPVDKYLSFFSIYQDWFMFAPNPSRTNIYITAKVEFDDGTSDVYDFERSEELGLLEKYSYGERYRKFMSEGIRKDSNHWMWKDVAKFSLRKVRDRNVGKIPVKVHLLRHWDDIPPLEVSFRAHGERLGQYKDFKFYTYEVI